MYGFLGFGGREYGLILLAVVVLMLPVVTLLYIIIRTFRDRGNQSRTTQ